MPRIIHLIAGYRGTGKDTLHKDLQEKSLEYIKDTLPFCDYSWMPIWFMFIIRFFAISIHLLLELLGCHRPVRAKWIVLGTRSSAIRANQQHLFVTKDRKKAAFAQSLKQEVHSIINRGLEEKKSDEWFEQHKDMLLAIKGVQYSVRDLYILTGENAKKKDPLVWVKKCFDSFAVDPDIRFPAGDSEIIDITDWRFKNELIYANFHSDVYKIFTTRVFRMRVIPSDNYTEHDLDNIATDLLLVPSYTDLFLALIQWPQYSRHMQIGVLRPI